MTSSVVRRLWSSSSSIAHCSCARSIAPAHATVQWSSSASQARTTTQSPHTEPRPSPASTARKRTTIPIPSQTSAASPTPSSLSTPHPRAAPSPSSPPLASRTTVYSWGSGAFGGLGCSSYRPHPNPQPVLSLSSLPSPIISLSSGWTYNLALTASGCVYHWGYKPFLRSLSLTAKLHNRAPNLLASIQSLNLGRFSLSNATTTPQPLRPFSPSNPAVRISCGGDFAAIVDAEGQLWTFGSGFFGQLGHSSKLGEAFLSQPKIVEALKAEGVRVKDVACGFNHLLILAEGGRVYVCGKHDHGALGIGKVLSEGKRLFYPHLVPSTCADPNARLSLDPNDLQGKTVGSSDPAPHYIGEVVQVSAGMKHSLLLTREGKVYASGHNQFGQCGFSPLDLTSTPLPSSALRASSPPSSSTFLSLSTFTRLSSLKPHRIASLSAGQHHSLFLTDTQRVLACGLNQQSQCGQLPAMATLRGSAAVSKWTQKQFQCVAEPQEMDVGGVEGVRLVAGFYDSVVMGRGGELVWWGTKMRQEGEKGRVEGVMRGRRVRDVSFGLVHSLVLTDEDAPAVVASREGDGRDQRPANTDDPRPGWY